MSYEKQELKVDNKYTLIFERTDEGTNFRALRHGEEWRDLSGDKLALSMFLRIIELENYMMDITKVTQEFDLTMQSKETT